MKYFCELDDFTKEIGVENFLLNLRILPIEISCLNFQKEVLETKSSCFSWLFSLSFEKDKGFCSEEEM